MPPLYRPMQARLPDEEDRAPTPLELFFDLSFVVAVAFASNRLHHAIATDDLSHGLLSYLGVFFAIWWAWMNFTWFASAYDCDDVPYRIMTMIQIAGALVLAAGVPRAFDSQDYTLVLAGYVVMRLALVTQWLRASYGDPLRRVTAQRFAIGISVAQAGWVILVVLHQGTHTLSDSTWGAGFLLLGVAEMLVPVWAEHASRTTWNPHHIAERYGLFTIIVLGESVLSSTTAIQTGLDAGHDSVRLISLAIGGLVSVFALWWLYFEAPSGRWLTTTFGAFTWGYGHLVIFGSAAAIGAGIAAAVDHEIGAASISTTTAGLATAVPIAVYLICLSALHLQAWRRGLIVFAKPVAAALILLVAPTGYALQLGAVVLVALMASHLLASRSTDEFETPLVGTEAFEPLGPGEAASAD